MGNVVVGFYSLQKLFNDVFLFPIDNLSAQVLKVDIYRHILVDDIYAVILENLSVDGKSLKIPNKEVIRIRKSTKDRQHNDQKKKDKQRFTKHT
jgi:hypothetical protein